jgi:hypothetical protein
LRHSHPVHGGGGRSLAVIRQLIQSDLSSGCARIPQVFGRTLYDRFQELHPDSAVDALTAEQTFELLAPVPGIAQISTILAGPLGILDSECARYLPPQSAHLELWHAYRNGRVISHGVQLNIFEKLGIARAYDAFEAVALKLPPASEWERGLAECAGGAPSANRLYSGIPILLGQCLAPQELTSLLVYILGSPDGVRLRRALAQPPRKQVAAEGKAVDVAERLTPSETHHLLLMLSNDVLARHVDDACQGGALRLHPDDVRSPSKIHNVSIMYQLMSGGIEIGALGVREDSGNNSARLATALLEAYSRAGILSDLGWKVRASGTEDLFAQLLDYVAEHGPMATVTKLAYSTRKVLDVVLDLLKFGPSFTKDSEAADRILWKCGFDMPTTDPGLPLLEERLAQFRDIVTGTGAINDEEARGRIRSAGVNLFVSIEEFLETIISYVTWILHTDPHSHDGLQYSASLARSIVSLCLAPLELNGPDDEVRPWDADGQNTLGCMMAYLISLNKWIQTIVGSTPDPTLLRPEHETPRFSEYPGRAFAFPYRRLWANISANGAALFKSQFADFASALARADIVGVRNGLDHKRSEDAFPSLEKLATFVIQFERALRIADVYRAYPKLFFVVAKSDDRYENTTYELSDTRRGRVEIREPSTVHGLRRLNILRAAGPVIVAPEGILGGAHSSLCIEVVRDSRWDAYWAGHTARSFAWRCWP